jgi:CHAT domain/Effector-associated domain 7
MDRTTLRETIRETLDSEELRDLCDDLGIDYDDLRGESKSAKARELVLYCERHSLMSELEAAYQRLQDKLSKKKESPETLPKEQATSKTTDEIFADLEIRFHPRDGQGYRVELTLDKQLGAQGYFSANILPWAPTGDLAKDGQQLLQALFTDQNLRSAWDRARGRSPRCRIRVWVDANASELHAIPWELLQEGYGMLSASADTPFSRYLQAWEEWGNPVKDSTIRVLVVISNPNDLGTKYSLPPVDMGLEEQTLRNAFPNVGQGELCIEFLPAPVTLAKLETALRDKSYHILHFLGHGAYSAKQQQAALYMQGDDGNAQRVTDDDLTGMLARLGAPPHLIFLAACQSAQSTTLADYQSAVRSTANTYLGLGPKLVSIGVPAVVAMQDTVTTATARQFSGVFYKQLLKHGVVDLATNEARSSLLTIKRPDAAVPVLFMRLQSGQLWTI